MMQLHRAFYDAQAEKAPCLKCYQHFEGALFHALNVATDQG